VSFINHSLKLRTMRNRINLMTVAALIMSSTAQAVARVIRNGREVDALNALRVQSIMSGLQVLNLSLVGNLVKNIKVTGDGTFIPSQPSPKDASKTMPAKWIYNTNFRSEVALNSPRVQEAYQAAMAAEAAGDVEKAHDAWREFLNYVTVSFSVPATAGQDAPFVRGQLVQGLAAHVQTEKGELVRFDSVSAMQARTATKAAVDINNLFAPKNDDGAGKDNKSKLDASILTS
jgi:hypothetical protein